MEQIIVTRPNATTWNLTRSADIKKAQQKRTLLGEDVITMSVESFVKLDFYIGDSIRVFGSTYTLNAQPALTKTGNRKFKYELTWEGKQYELLKVQYQLDLDGTDSVYSDFSLTGNLQAFTGLIITNLARVYGEGKYTLGSCPETETITETFANENCLQVLQALCGEGKFNKEFELIEDESGNIIINIVDAIGQALGLTYRYGKGKALYELKRQTVSNKNIVTRLYAFGSQKNLSSNYRGYSQRLKIPGIARSYIEDATALAEYGLIESTKIFENIYPHRTGSVTALSSSAYRFSDSSMDFDLKADDGNGNTIYLIAGTSAKIHFNTGNLAGYEFEVMDYNHATREFTIKPFADERGQAFPDPNTAAFRIGMGDEYVILDIMMPQTYIDAAETELLAAAQIYLAQNCQPRVQYSLKIDKTYLEKLYSGQATANVYGIGDSVNVTDTDIGVDKAIRIRAFTRNVLDPYDYDLDLNDIQEKGMLQRMIASTIETEKALAINQLKDPVRAMRSWKSTRELLDMVFDPDGYFNGEKINPETIETIMLSVGTKSQQFALSAVIEPNLQGNPEQVNVRSGILAHFGIEANIRDWTITGGIQSLSSTASLYVYARCEIGSATGVILFTTQQIQTDGIANYYHFLIGILHAAIDGVRWISLTYGSTVINGAFIRTGRIVSQDGLTYFDLDSSEIGGVIRFQSGKYDDEIENDIATAQNSADSAAWLATSKKRHFTAQPAPPYNVGDLWTNGYNLYRCIVERLTGNYTASDWQLATTYDRTETAINGGIITTGRIEVGGGALGAGNAGIQGSVSGTPDTDIRFWAGATFANRATAPFRVQNNGHIIATLGQIAGWLIASDAIYRGTKKITDGYSTDGITIAGDGSIHAKKFFINADGTVNLAGLELPHIVPKAASTNLRHSNDDAESFPNAAWQKAKGITFTNGLLGTVNISFALMKTETVSGAAYGLIRRNGIAIGTQRTATASFVTFTEAITQNWEPGDCCELWVYSASGVTVIVKDFRISYDNSPTVAVAAVND